MIGPAEALSRIASPGWPPVGFGLGWSALVHKSVSLASEKSLGFNLGFWSPDSRTRNHPPSEISLALAGSAGEDADGHDGVVGALILVSTMLSSGAMIP